MAKRSSKTAAASQKPAKSEAPRNLFWWVPVGFCVGIARDANASQKDDKERAVEEALKMIDGNLDAAIKAGTVQFVDAYSDPYLGTADGEATKLLDSEKPKKAEKPAKADKKESAKDSDKKDSKPAKKAPAKKAAPSTKRRASGGRGSRAKK